MRTGYKKTFLMAPNYPAGKDMRSRGYMRYFRGREGRPKIYTKLGQNRLRRRDRADPRLGRRFSVFFFLPGGMGIAFMKQYDQPRASTSR